MSETRIRGVLKAAVWGIAASCAVAGFARAADDDVVKEKKEIVITDGEGEPQVFVWNGDGPGVFQIGGSGPWLGVTLTEETKLDEGGARVTSVLPDSPAAKAGLKKGDVIVGFQGDVIRGPARLTERIHAAKAGDAVTLDVVRDGSRQTLRAELAERKNGFRMIAPEGLDEGKLKLLDERLKNLKIPEIEGLAPLRELRFWGSGPRLGVELVSTTPELRRYLGASSEAGVLVGRVLTGTPAEKAGIKVGDVIVSVDGAPVEGAGDIVEAISEKAGKSIVVELVRDRRTIKVTATLPERKDDDVRGPRAWVPAPPAPPAPPAAPPPPAPPAAPVLMDTDV